MIDELYYDGTLGLDGKPIIHEWECFAREIKDGQWFMKRTGTTVYLRMSDSAVKWHKLDPAFIYGVCFNGNVAAVPLDKIVCKATLEDYLANIQSVQTWEENMGCKEFSNYGS